MKTCGECERCDRTLAYPTFPEQYMCMETGRTNTLDHACDLEFRIHEVLGVKRREVFYVRGKGYDIGPLQVDDAGDVVRFDTKEYVGSTVVTRAVNDPSLVVHGGMKKDELELCKILGANYVSRDGYCSEVSLWREIPASHCIDGETIFDESNGATLAAVVYAPDMFRWIGSNTIAKIEQEEVGA